MKRALHIAAFMLLAAAPAQAGTFCVSGPTLAPQCIYEDIQSCKAAAMSDAACTISPDAYLMYYGAAKYCTVTTDRLAQCLYDDRGQCNAAAGRDQALCIDREEVKQDQVNPDPFRYDQRIQNF
jgi:hypothetical protein